MYFKEPRPKYNKHPNAMRKNLPVLLFACLLFQFSFAARPQDSHSLWDHLLNVNVQWEKQITDAEPFQFPIAFADETERIRMHLLLVESHLRERSVEHLNLAQQVARLQRLDELHAYAEAGLFPQNYSLEKRTPFFIDVHGTACAVGHLLIESGNRAFAERIHDERNNAYILDMPYAEIPSWADQNGFTTAELAWIQPGYPLTDPVVPYGSILPNGAIEFLKYDFPSNSIIFAGQFTEVDGTPCQGIASWDGNSLTTYGNGLLGTVEDVENLQGTELIAVGENLDGAGANVAIWRNGQWDFFQPAAGKIHDVASLGNIAYFGGELFNQGFSQIYSLPMGGTSFSAVGDGFAGPIYALGSYQGEMYAGGDFQAVGLNAANYISRFNGSDWVDAGMGMDTTVYAFGYGANGEFLAGGILADSNYIQKMGLSEWDGTTWLSMLNPNPQFATGVYDIGDRIDRIEKDIANNEIRITGNFSVLFGFDFGHDAAVYIDSLEVLRPLATPDNDIVGIVPWDNGYILGGDFSNVNGYNIDFWGFRTVASSIVDPTVSQVSVFPNPAQDRLYIKIAKVPADVHVELMDFQGRKHAVAFEVEGENIRVERGDLAEGAYLILLSEGTQIVGSQKVIFK